MAQSWCITENVFGNVDTLRSDNHEDLEKVIVISNVVSVVAGGILLGY